MNRFLTILALALIFSPVGLASEAPEKGGNAGKWQQAMAAADKQDVDVFKLSPWAAVLGDKNAEKTSKDLIEDFKKQVATAISASSEDRAEARKAFKEGARATRIAAFDALMSNGVPKDAKAAKALSAQIVDFVSVWNPLFKDDASVDNEVHSAILPYLPMVTLADFQGRPAPFKPFESAADYDAFVRSLERVKAFIPDMRTAKLFDKTESNSSTVEEAKNDQSGMVIRACVNAVVDDLNKTYGGIEAPLALRKAIVAEYSKATTLGATGPMATLFAILGSLILFGGLALALYKAANSKKKPETA